MLTIAYLTLALSTASALTSHLTTDVTVMMDMKSQLMEAPAKVNTI